MQRCVRMKCSGPAQYQNALGQTGCKTVSDGYFTTPVGTVDGKTGQTQCVAGTACSGGIQTECGSNTEFSFNSSATSCTNVQTGYYSTPEGSTGGGNTVTVMRPSAKRDTDATVACAQCAVHQTSTKTPLVARRARQWTRETTQCQKKQAMQTRRRCHVPRDTPATGAFEHPARAPIRTRMNKRRPAANT